MISLLITRCCDTACTSTMGDSPVTVTDSATEPTLSAASIVAVNEPVSSIPSRLYGENPASVKVTAYVPGRRSTIRYWPAPSVVTERTFSINTGLDASTVTPGSTAPVASLTAPAMEAWAKASAGKNTVHARTNATSLVDPRILSPSTRRLESDTDCESPCSNT